MMSVVRAGDEDAVQAAAVRARADRDPKPTGRHGLPLLRAPATAACTNARAHPALGAGLRRLALLLGLQLVWAERRPLTAQSAFAAVAADRVRRTWAAPLPPVADLDKLQLLSRDVRPHPSVPGALIISATVRNNARFTQPYPGGHDHALRSGRQPHRHAPLPPVRLPRRRRHALPAAWHRAPSAALVFEVKRPGQEGRGLRVRFPVIACAGMPTAMQ